MPQPAPCWAINPGHICHDGTPRSRRAVVCCGGSRWQRSRVSRSPRAVPFAILAVLTVLALAAAALAIATAPRRRRRLSPARPRPRSSTATRSRPLGPRADHLHQARALRRRGGHAHPADDGAQVEVWLSGLAGLGEGRRTRHLQPVRLAPHNLKALLPAGYKGVIYRRAPTAACRCPRAFPLVVFSHGYRAIATSRASSRRASPPGLRGGRPRLPRQRPDSAPLGQDRHRRVRRSRPRRASDTISLMGSRTHGTRAPCTTRSTCPRWQPSATRSAGRSPKRPRPLTLASRPSSGSPGRPSARSGRPAPVQEQGPRQAGLLMVGTTTTSSGQEPSPAPIAPWSSRSA